LSNLLLDQNIAKLLLTKKHPIQTVIMHAIQTGYPIGGFMTAQSYFDAYRSEHLPTNLIQAQRDYFGAHTYQRTDEPGTFHTEWEG
jgi:6-phosphogluconate dehydrogenase